MGNSFSDGLPPIRKPKSYDTSTRAKNKKDFDWDANPYLKYVALAWFEIKFVDGNDTGTLSSKKIFTKANAKACCEFLEKHAPAEYERWAVFRETVQRFKRTHPNFPNPLIHRIHKAVRYQYSRGVDAETRTGKETCEHPLSRSLPEKRAYMRVKKTVARILKGLVA